MHFHSVPIQHETDSPRYANTTHITISNGNYVCVEQGGRLVDVTHMINGVRVEASNEAQDKLVFTPDRYATLEATLDRSERILGARKFRNLLLLRQVRTFKWEYFDADFVGGVRQFTLHKKNDTQLNYFGSYLILVQDVNDINHVAVSFAFKIRTRAWCPEIMWYDNNGMWLREMRDMFQARLTQYTGRKSIDELDREGKFSVTNLSDGATHIRKGSQNEGLFDFLVESEWLWEVKHRSGAAIEAIDLLDIEPTDPEVQKARTVPYRDGKAAKGHFTTAEAEVMAEAFLQKSAREMVLKDFGLSEPPNPLSPEPHVRELAKEFRQAVAHRLESLRRYDYRKLPSGSMPILNMNLNPRGDADGRSQGESGK